MRLKSPFFPRSIPAAILTDPPYTPHVHTGARMDWTKRNCVGFTMNVAPSEERHGATEDGHVLVAMLQDDRHRGGGRGIFVRLYGEDPCRSSTPPIAPRRMPTFEEIRDAVDEVAPAGSHWVMAQPVFKATPGADYPFPAVWTDGPPLTEVIPQNPAAQLVGPGGQAIPPELGGRPRRVQ